MKIRNLILCGVMGLMLGSCSTKQSAINQLESFSYELRDHSRDYDVDDWERAGKKFVKIRDRISKHEFDYTAEEKTKIGRLEGDCIKYMAKGAKDGVFDKLINFGSEIKGIIQSIMDALDPKTLDLEDL
ncbi:MAG: hypothetical protein IKD75_14610 [Prevotella sp.]|nr:hypothetical protein [Prevotella sp.]